MALSASDLNFNIEFNFENGTSKFVIDDNTTYPSDGIDYGMVFKIESPSGVLYQTPNAGDSILTHTGSGNEVIETGEGDTWDSSQSTTAIGFTKTPFTIPKDSDGNFEYGTYKFTIYAYKPFTGTKEALVTSKSYTITYDSTYAPPEASIKMSYDFLTATVSASDQTSYNILSTTPTLSRVTKVTYPKPTGTFSNTSATSVAKVTYPNLYTGSIIGSIDTTATYDFNDNYTVVYEVQGTNSISIDDNTSIQTAYTGLKTTLTNVDANTGSQREIFQKQAEEIGTRLQAATSAFQSGNATDAAGHISKAISLANLTVPVATTGTVQVTPVATAAASDDIDVTGNASKGTEAIKTAAASGTSFKVQLTDTANNKLNNAITDSDVDYSVSRFRTESIPESRGTTQAALTTGGGTKNLTPGTDGRYIVYTGSGTLSSSWTIQIDPSLTSTDLIDGDSVLLQYKATFTPNGNSVTIFGTTLTDDQILGGNVFALATYDEDGDTWHYQVIDGSTIKRLYDSSNNEILDTSSGQPVLTNTPNTASSATAVLVRATPSGEIKIRADITKDGDISNPTYYRGLSTPVPQNGFGTTTTDLSSVTSGTKNLTEGTADKRQIFTGTTTLTGSYTVTNNGTPIDGDVFEIDWRSAMTLDGNTLTIFGQSINSTLALNGFLLRAVYDGDTTAYRVEIFPDLSRSAVIDTSNLVNDSVTSAKIAPSAVTSADMAINSVTTQKIKDSAVETDKIKDNAVTVTKFSTTAQTDVKTLPISFETGETGKHKMRFPWSCTVNRIDYALTKTAASASSVQALDDSGGVMSTTSISLGTAIGSTVSEPSITTNNTFTAGDEIQLKTSGAGGKAVASITITRSE